MAKFRQPPLLCPLREYEETERHVRDLLLSTSGVTRVVTVGSVGAPGVSDVDLVAVVADDAAVPRWRADAVAPRHRYPLMHPPAAVRESDLALLPLVYDTRGFADAPPARVAPVLAGAFAVGALADFAGALACGRFRVRSLLCRLHSVAANFSLVGEESPLSDDVETVRRRWFSTERPSPTLQTLLSVALGEYLRLLRIAEERTAFDPPPPTRRLRLWRHERVTEGATPGVRWRRTLSGRIAGAFDDLAAWLGTRVEVTVPPRLFRTLAALALGSPPLDGLEAAQRFIARYAAEFSGSGFSLLLPRLFQPNEPGGARSRLTAALVQRLPL